mmetsp:Transcript_21793/g.56606  ORF Transcript_21793/g.56606 Transcript_21793/m.56606 type:complete len:200 (-) Transcript_21793:47-646(-)
MIRSRTLSHLYRGVHLLSGGLPTSAFSLFPPLCHTFQSIEVHHSDVIVLDQLSAVLLPFPLFHSQYLHLEASRRHKQTESTPSSCQNIFYQNFAYPLSSLFALLQLFAAFSFRHEGFCGQVCETSRRDRVPPLCVYSLSPFLFLPLLCCDDHCIFVVFSWLCISISTQSQRHGTPRFSKRARAEWSKQIRAMPLQVEVC